MNRLLCVQIIGVPWGEGGTWEWMRSRATLAWLSLGLTPMSEHRAQARRRHLLLVLAPHAAGPMPPARPSCRPSLFGPSGLPQMCFLSSVLHSCTASDQLMSNAHR